MHAGLHILGVLCVVSSTQSKIYALDASTGKTAWEAYGVSRFNGVTSDVTVYKGLLFAGTRSGAVVVLNAATGKEISIINSRSTVRGAVALAPSGSGGDFVFTSQDTEIYVGKFTTSPKKAADAGYNVTGLQYNLITTTPALYSDGTTSLAFVTTQGASGGSGGSLLKLDSTCHGAVAAFSELLFTPAPFLVCLSVLPQSPPPTAPFYTRPRAQ